MPLPSLFRMSFRSRAVALWLAVFAVPFLVALRPALAVEPIKIGFGMALTGALAGNGKAALTTIQLWAEEVNAKGGLLGRPVKLVYYDDQTSPSIVPGLYTKLLDVDRVDIVLSGYGTAVAAPAMPIVMPRGKLFMALFALGVNEQFGYDRYFQIMPLGPDPRTAVSRGFFEIAKGLTPAPRTVAIAYADSEFPNLAAGGARDLAREAGLQVVYDRSYPLNTVDFSSIVRSIQAAKPDVVYVASLPVDSTGIVRAANEVGLKTRLFGGTLNGPQFASIKQQLGAQLNGLVTYELFVPEPTVNSPGVMAFLAKYQERAKAEGVDPLGYYLPPFAYAAMQVIEQAIRSVGSLDQKKLAEHVHANRFETVVGAIQFAANGEWSVARNLFIQYQGVVGNDLDQFRRPGTHAILYPTELRSGELRQPYQDAKR